jgi:murein DD-endopeptidase MepM/ murein hydrolase activator NlpD
VIEPVAVVSLAGSSLDLPRVAVAVAAGKARAKPRYVFPVRGSRVSFHKSNAHAGYPATDIFAACGKPVVATTSGVVLEVSRVDRYRKGRPAGPYNGGKFVSIRGDDGVRYYGSHLSKVQGGMKRGVRVKAGQVLGKVGRTGNASGVCHLHYGISPPCKGVGDWKVRQGVVWPAKYLTSWRKGGQRSPAAAVKAWQKKHCQAPGLVESWLAGFQGCGDRLGHRV